MSGPGDFLDRDDTLCVSAENVSTCHADDGELSYSLNACDRRRSDPLLMQTVAELYKYVTFQQRRDASVDRLQMG